jgi:hypothetical protein
MIGSRRLRNAGDLRGSWEWWDDVVGPCGYRLVDSLAPECDSSMWAVGAGF